MRLLKSFGKGVAEGVALLLLISAVQSCSGCATVGKIQQVSYVGARDVAELLNTVQIEESKLVCGRDAAPAPPACVPIDLHHTIQGYILEAAGYDRQAIAIARSLPTETPTPLKVMELIAKIYDVVDRIIKSLPKSAQSDALAAKIGR